MGDVNSNFALQLPFIRSLIWKHNWDRRRVRNELGI